MSGWNPIESPSEADFAIVGNLRTPGICTIRNAHRPRQWDDQRSPGMTGATARFRGVSLGTFDMELQLATLQDWRDWHDFRGLLDPVSAEARSRFERRRDRARSLAETTGKVEDAAAAGGISPPRPLAFDIVHPVLAMIGIKAAVVLDVKIEQQTDEGMWVATISWKEFRRPEPAWIAPINGSSPRTENNADVSIQLEIARAAGELAAEERAYDLIRRGVL